MSELTELREELSKLRERVAILESNPHRFLPLPPIYVPAPAYQPPPSPGWWQSFPPGTITCEAKK